MEIPSYKHWIGGESVGSKGGERFVDLNPLDDSPYANIERGTEEDVRDAVAAADVAFETYRHSLPVERERWLHKAADLIEVRSKDLIEILIDEVGSPILKAQREIATATGVLRAAAAATRFHSGKTMPTDVRGRLSLSVRRPLGVIAGITPFNVPLIKNVKHSAMPLATGNTVVLLPSALAPVIACRLSEIYAEAGFPPGVFNVVTGFGHEIGDALTTDPHVRMVGFTGSTQIGRHIAEQCGRLGKRCKLEMGGKNPLVVLRDANIDSAIQASVVGSFIYQGQICMASSRIYVEQPLMEEFVDKFSGAASELGMGDLRIPSTMIGPIIGDRQRIKIREHLSDAIKKGALVQCGGQWEHNRCQPTVLTNVTDAMTLAHAETFGPITAVHAVESPEEALRRANETTFGLCASVFTSDLKQAMRFAEGLEAGMVHVNGTTIQEEPHVPFGGIGDSGQGRESTDPDLDDMTEWKWITLHADS
ncbi:MAG: aldehyde dehydrogenase family protein [Rubripirellula sp.]